MKFVALWQRWLHRGHFRMIPLIFLVVCFYLAGCGGDDEELKDFITNPKPPSIEATVTPEPRTITLAGNFTPEPDPSIDDENDAADEEGDTDDESDAAESTDSSEKTSADSQNSDDSDTTPDEGTNGQASSKSSTASEEKMAEATPTPTPKPTTKPTPTAAPQKKKSAEEKQETAEAHADAEESQTSRPIITPYGITIDKLVACSKISNRNPHNPGDTFSISKTRAIYVWMRVSGVKPTRTIKHIYYWEGSRVSTVSLKLKYASMRTWSKKTLKPLEALGKWKIVITTENEDEILAAKEITIVK